MVVLIEGAKFCCHSAGLQDNYVDFIWALWFCWYCQGQEGFSVSHSLWGICSSNPSTFTQEVLLTQPTVWSLGKEAPGWHPTSSEASVRRDKIKFLIFSAIRPKNILVHCWPGASGSSFQNDKWISTGFHMWSAMMQYILPAGHTSSSLFSIAVHLVEWLAFTCEQWRFYHLTIKKTSKKTKTQQNLEPILGGKWKAKGKLLLI